MNPSDAGGMTVLTASSEMCFVLFCFVWDRVSLYSPGCPGTHPVGQAGLKLTEILLPLPPECWDQRRAPPPAARDVVYAGLWKEFTEVK